MSDGYRVFERNSDFWEEEMTEAECDSCIHKVSKEDVDALIQQGRAEMLNEIKIRFKLAISEKPNRTINEAEAEIILRNVEKQIKEQKNEEDKT